MVRHPLWVFRCSEIYFCLEQWESRRNVWARYERRWNFTSGTARDRSALRLRSFAVASQTTPNVNKFAGSDEPPTQVVVAIGTVKVHSNQVRCTSGVAQCTCVWPDGSIPTIVSYLDFIQSVIQRINPARHFRFNKLINAVSDKYAVSELTLWLPVHVYMDSPPSHPAGEVQWRRYRFRKRSPGIKRSWSFLYVLHCQFRGTWLTSRRFSISPVRSALHRQVVLICPSVSGMTLQVSEKLRCQCHLPESWSTDLWFLSNFWTGSWIHLEASIYAIQNALHLHEISAIYWRVSSHHSCAFSFLERR